MSAQLQTEGSCQAVKESHHGCSHTPDHFTDISSSRLVLTLILNFIIPTVQIIGGLYAHSMALVSDAMHNFSDFTAILITFLAFRISRKGASVYNTFGYKRADVLAALMNVAILIGASAIIVYEAVQRLYHPESVLGKIVIWIAGIGVIGNGFSAWLLHRDSEHSLNVRGAFLHMIGDFLTSVVVVINGVVLMFYPWYWIDPVLSILIALFILKNCWMVIKEAAPMLMNATPKHISIVSVKETLERLPEVQSVHYLHAWSVNPSSIAFSAHVVVADQLLSQTEQLVKIIRDTLFRQFGIDHAVLQLETAECGNGGLLCEMSCAGDAQHPEEPMMKTLD